MGVCTVRCDLTTGVCVIRGGEWTMPSDMVSFAVSTGLGVSVLAGIISGVCYVLAHGVQRKSSRKPREWYCDVCGTYLRSIDGILEGDKVVTCSKCKARVCKYRCSTLCQREGWTCTSCLRPHESWFQGILNAIQPSNKASLTKRMNTESLNEIDEDLEVIRKKEKEEVRDFIERLVNVMLGENVDDACVTKLYNDSQYDGIFARYHQDLSNALTDLGSALHISIANLPITGQSPCTAHAALKQLIERLLREALTLPNLQKTQDTSVPSDESNRTYEDLLATAIINKVITSCQNNLPSSSAASVSSRVSNSSHHRDDKEFFFGEETIDNKWKTTDLDSSSVSSLEEWLQSDSSFGSRKFVDRVTLTIKQDIEEVSQTESEDENEEDDTEYFKKTLLNEDESNWILQRKQFQGTHSPVPVPMLVPNPTTEAKVLIGDKEVDDTSDLSDIASDYEDPDPIPTRQSLLVESKMIIGGKNPLQNGSESESSADSGVKEVGSRDRSGYDGPIFISKTDITVDDDNVEDSSILSVYSNTEKEAEYTEKYGSLPRMIAKPIPPSRPSLQKSKLPESTNEEEATNAIDGTEEYNNSDGNDDEEEEKREFTGSYSKKEKEKWKHAIEMKNNPYSKENIEKRIKRSNSSVSSLFGPDYYARQASSPSGGKLGTAEVRQVVWPPPNSKEEEATLHKAIPVFVSPENETPITPEIKYQSPSVIEIGEAASSELTSDSDLSYVNFYDVENSQIYKAKTGEQVTLLVAKLLPEDPVINMPSVDVEKSDMNGNLSSEKDKHPFEGDPEEVSHQSVKKIISKGKVEDKPNFAKATPAPRQRTLAKQGNSTTLKRFKSETDLLEDSFDKPPTIISRKKDNTLISKIYLDPNVRNFALSNRNQLPPKNNEVNKPPLRNQLSIDANVFAAATNNDVNKAFYNSDEGLSNAVSKKSYYSSEEDLSSMEAKNEHVPAFRGFQNPNVRRSRVNSRPSISSEDGLLSDSSTNLDKPNRPRSTRSFIYSSSEDLLSIDEVERVPKRKDNTLISKIYQDPNVRNFALSNRDYIPVSEESVPPKSPRYRSSSADDLLSQNSVRQFIETKKRQVKTPESNGNSMTSGISLDSLKIDDLPSTTIAKPPEAGYERKMVSPDPDIGELAKKKIVHNILNQMSKSQTNLAESSRPETPRERKISTDSEEICISVKDLKKKFENNDAKNRVVSSLTARSLSKQMRDNLKN